jgi:ribA/ribD-fused uncharacterized protein
MIVEVDEGQEEMDNFPTAEHWMMLQKALLFADDSVARKVIAISDASNSQMRLVKTLGRHAKNFSEETWRKERERIVLEGSLLEFRRKRRIETKAVRDGRKDDG